MRPELQGRPVQDVRILGNRQAPAAVILNAIRTREGEPFDSSIVQEDYQRIYDLRKFSNVQAKIEPTAEGVIVVFIVTEQNQISAINYRGNVHIETETLQNLVDLQIGQAVDQFRLAMARQTLESYYRDKNYPFAHVEILPGPLAGEGIVVFNIVEGPNVRIRKIDFVGNKTFSSWKLKDQIQTRNWVWIFRPGTFEPDLLEDDVAALRRFYEQKGFFDVRVGRKIGFSPDQKAMQVTFLIDEGTRYTIEQVSFNGNQSIPDEQLRQNLRLLEGQPYDGDLLQRDIRQIVKAYSPFGFIYQPQSNDPDYLRIDAKPLFRRDAGKVDLVYEISEGKPFRVGRILVKGNTRTKQKVVLREMRVAPGEVYDSAELQDAADRLRSTPYFNGVSITPIGSDPETRDVLVEVNEAKTALINIGAGINSNGGLGANISYEQRNFDIANPPGRLGEIFSDRAFTGAGQNFRASLEPGTEATNASIRFTEPWIFDQPYSFSTELYLRDREREDYDDRRVGARVTLGKRFNYIWSSALTLRGEDVNIDDINDPEVRAIEILEEEGHNTLTSAGLQIRRDTTRGGFLPYTGTNTVASWEAFGALGGDYSFHRLGLSWDGYQTVGEDLLDRKTIIAYRADAGYITGDSPFFERFYGGGIGSVRGFQFRGISPRSGIEEDRVGGDFSLSGSVELSFPLVSDTFRGVVFTDAGTVEPDFRIGKIRTSVGAGIRLILPIFGQAPLALDFAYPITKDDEDDTQIISFSFGITR